MTKRLVLDFDGVLHAYTSGWQGEGVVADGPVPGAVEFLVEATKRFDVYVYSSRSTSLQGRVAMATAIDRWLSEVDLSLDERVSVMGKLWFPDYKPAAHLTIDDRAVTFTGKFPTLDEVDSFVPWNKKPPVEAELPPPSFFLVVRPKPNSWDLCGIYATRDEAAAGCRYCGDFVTEIPVGVDVTDVKPTDFPLWKATDLRPELAGVVWPDLALGPEG
jgi:hypothetical protein